MAKRSLQGFTTRVWLFVCLVAAYLVLFQFLHFVSARAAHARVRRAFEERCRIAAAAAVHEASVESLARSLREWERGARNLRLNLSRTFLDEHGIVAVALLTPAGWGIDASVRTGAPSVPVTPTVLADAALQRLETGESVLSLDAAETGDPHAAVVLAWEPVMTPDARLLGILQVELAAGELAASRRQMLGSLAVEGGSLLAFLGLLFAFMRWTLQPLQLLARTADEPDAAATARLAEKDETGFVIETYRRMIEQLREKEQELRRLRQVERHRADELQELNASIVDSMVSGVVVLDLSGRVRSMNDVAREILRIDDARVVGRPVDEVLRGVPELRDRMRSCLDSGGIARRDEIRLNLPGVGRRDLGVTVSPLKDAAGQRTGALCLIVDLTEVKRLQEQVRLKASLAELGELSAGVAHEFRNSLASIQGFAQLVERQGEGDVVEHASAIRAECTALRAVVDDFLRFANPTRIMLEPVDLDAIFRELAADVEARGAGKRIRYEVVPGLPVVTGDETLLRRVLGNLLRNAADAVGPEGQVRVSGERGAGELTVHVDDDGPGIAPADRDRIFVPFFTRKEGGTGLGLALARKVVVHHGGHLSVDTSPLGGARFSVTLPLPPDHAPATLEGTTPAALG